MNKHYDKIISGRKMPFLLSLIFIIFILYYQHHGGDDIIDNTIPINSNLNDTYKAHEFTPNTASIENSRFNKIIARKSLNRILISNEKAYRIAKLKPLILEWLTHDSTDLMLAISGVSPALLKQEILVLAINLWLDLDSDKLFKWLSQRNIDESLDLALISLSENTHIPESVGINLCQYIFDLDMYNRATTSIFIRWINRDFDDAFQWLKISDDRIKKYASNFFNILVQENLLLAIDSLNELDLAQQNLAELMSDEIQKKLLSSVVSEEIIASILPLLFNPKNNELAKQILSALIKQLPPSQTEELISMLDSDDGEAMQVYLAYTWAKFDPVAAGEFAQSLSSGTRRSESINNVVLEWAKEDIVAASTWLSSVQGEREQAIRTITMTSIESGEIEIAKNWLRQIKGRDNQQEPAFHLIRVIYDTNPVSAKEYLRDSSAFSEEEKEGVWRYLIEQS